jgi:hypothetical protein
MWCVRSVGYCRGEDERLDLLELWVLLLLSLFLLLLLHDVSNGVRNAGSKACLQGAAGAREGEGQAEAGAEAENTRGGGSLSWLRLRSVKIPKEDVCAAAAASTETAIFADEPSEGGI